MKYRLIVTKKAEADLEDASDWYENQQKGLGVQYVLTVKASIKLIVTNPFAYAKVFLQIRKANTEKFPYSIYYSTNKEDKEIIIFAVIHASRSDKVWKQRIDEN